MVLSSWLPDSVEIRGRPLVGGLKTGTGWESRWPLTTYYTNTMLLVMNETDAYRWRRCWSSQPVSRTPDLPHFASARRNLPPPGHLLGNTGCELQQRPPSGRHPFHSSLIA